MSLRAWVNVVYGKMTRIDRKKKLVTVNHNTFVPYDHLILCTGTQYQVPTPTEADVSQHVTNNEVPNNPARRFEGVPPKNVFTINDQYEAAVALYWAECNLLTNEGKTDVPRYMFFTSCLFSYLLTTKFETLNSDPVCHQCAACLKVTARENCFFCHWLVSESAWPVVSYM